MVDYDLRGVVDEDAVDAGVEDAHVSDDDVAGVVEIYAELGESDWSEDDDVGLMGDIDDCGEGESEGGGEADEGIVVLAVGMEISFISDHKLLIIVDV